MLPLIVALVGAFVGSLCLFGGLVVHVPNNQDFEFKDRLRAYLASSPYGDLIESTDLACSFISCALYIGGTYLSNEPEWMSTLELAFAISCFLCCCTRATSMKSSRHTTARPLNATGSETMPKVKGFSCVVLLLISDADSY